MIIIVPQYSLAVAYVPSFLLVIGWFPSGVPDMRRHTAIRASLLLLRFHIWCFSCIPSFLLLFTWAVPAPCLYHYIIAISGLLCHPQVLLLLVPWGIALCEAIRCWWLLFHLLLHISLPHFLFMTWLRVQQRCFLFWSWLAEFIYSSSASFLPTASSRIVGSGV